MDAVRFDNPELPKTRSESALPLRYRNRVIGALTVQSSEPSAFDQDIITVLQTMADQIAIALENAYLFSKNEAALDAADEACKEGRLDVSSMERLIEALLAKQLARVYEMAGGRLREPTSEVTLDSAQTAPTD